MQWGFEPYLAENGVKIIGQPYAKTVSFDTPAAEQTFQFLSNLMYKYHVAAPGSDLGTDAAANNNEDQQLFAKGKVAMIEAGDWITAGLPSEVKFPIGVLRFPAGAGRPVDRAQRPHRLGQRALPQSAGRLGAGEVAGLAGLGEDPRRRRVHLARHSLPRPAHGGLLEEARDRHPAVPDRIQLAHVYWPVTPGMDKAQLDIANLLAPAYLTGKNVPGAVAAAAKQANEDL